MKFRFLTIFLLCSFTWASNDFAATKKKPRVIFQSLHLLQSRINAIVDAKELATGITGVKITSLEDGTTVYELNSRKHFHPASNTKLITTAAILAKIPRYSYRTRLFSGSNIDNGILNGNLYVKGGGDPLLISSDIDSLALFVTRRGIHTITGNIVGDISYFDTVGWGRGWMWDDEPSSDEPFITPLSVDSNSICVSIVPGIVANSQVSYSIAPQCDLFKIINNGLTQSGGLPLTLNRVRGSNTVLIGGTVDPGRHSQDFTYSIRKPELVFLHLLKERLLARGITVNGNCSFDLAREKNPLGEINHSLDSVLVRVNKESYNLGAENLLKTLAAEVNGIPGTWDNGILVVKSYLYKLGIDTAGVVLVDGSGVSFYNLFTPFDMIRLLIAQYRSKANFQRYYASLPIAGVDGTLRNRMKGTPAAGNVRAKTGTLTGASCLSGYVTTADKKLLAFSFMNNHFPGEGRKLREMQDQLLELLAGWSTDK